MEGEPQYETSSEYLEKVADAGDEDAHMGEGAPESLDLEKIDSEISDVITKEAAAKLEAGESPDSVEVYLQRASMLKSRLFDYIRMTWEKHPGGVAFSVGWISILSLFLWTQLVDYVPAETTLGKIMFAVWGAGSLAAWPLNAARDKANSEGTSRK